MACSGVIIILLLTSGFGRPGSIVAKSMMNSLCECVMIARFEYAPFAISCFSSMLNSFSFAIICGFIIIISAILALIQKDLLKAAILTGFSGGALAVLFQILLAPDVALTQAIVGAAIVPVFIALAVKKTQRGDA